MATDDKRTKLAIWEILLWTAGWIFGVGYSIYHVYLASKRTVKENEYQPLAPF